MSKIANQIAAAIAAEARFDIITVDGVTLRGVKVPTMERASNQFTDAKWSFAQDNDIGTTRNGRLRVVSVATLTQK